MRARKCLFYISATLITAVAGSGFAADQMPSWAYLGALQSVNLQGQPVAAPPPDPTPRRVPNSSLSFTDAQIRDATLVVDWHPEDHPPAPDIVTKGAPGVMACGFCHMPNGYGRPANASLAGLPEDYIVRQMAEMKSDHRVSSAPDMPAPKIMRNIAKLATDEQVRAAAKFYANTVYKRWIRVVETASVPKVRVSGAMYVPVAGAPKEPIGQRILEMPEDEQLANLSDSHSGFVAYVPPQSIKRGEVIATRGVLTGNKGKVTPCTACHGADLRGMGPVPGLAGRSPSHLVRQLYDMQQGHRAGLWAPLMKEAVEKMDTADMVAVAAFAASQEP